MNCEKCNIEMSMYKYEPLTRMFIFVCRKCGSSQKKTKFELEEEYREKNRIE